MVVDVHERRSGVPEALREPGLGVRLRTLATGDYAIDDLALIERKSVQDLHLSVIRGQVVAATGIASEVGAVAISRHRRDFRVRRTAQRRRGWRAPDRRR
jgi:hypothetical protein